MKEVIAYAVACFVLVGFVAYSEKEYAAHPEYYVGFGHEEYCGGEVGENDAEHCK